MVTRFRTLYQRHPEWFEIGFFVAGFIYDIATLDRIDSTWSIVQQAVFIAIGYAILAVRFAEDLGRIVVGPRLMKIWRWRDLAFQFVAGSLLSSYTLFFFKSASIASSFVFLGLLIGLLLVNEFFTSERFEFWMRSVIMSLCLVCFFIYLVPIGLGTVGTLTFGASLLVASGFFALIHLLVRKVLNVPARELSAKWRVPFLGVLVAMSGLYFVRLIPPIPLSLEYMGVFHDVKKSQGRYELTFFRPWWRFWESGAQNFERLPGEPVYCFFSVFSPVSFSDKVYVRWWLKDPRAGWQGTDRIPIRIEGGRDEGFRGFTFKKNVADGEWRITVETEDERELGRIRLSIRTDPDSDRREAKVLTL